MRKCKGSTSLIALCLVFLGGLFAALFHQLSFRSGSVIRNASTRALAKLEAESVFEYGQSLVLNREALPSWDGSDFTFPCQKVLGLYTWLYQQFNEVATDTDFVSPVKTLELPLEVRDCLSKDVTAQLEFQVEGLASSSTNTAPWPMYDKASSNGLATIIVKVKLNTPMGEHEFERKTPVAFLNGTGTI